MTSDPSRADTLSRLPLPGGMDAGTEPRVAAALAVGSSLFVAEVAGGDRGVRLVIAERSHDASDWVIRYEGAAGSSYDGSAERPEAQLRVLEAIEGEPRLFARFVVSGEVSLVEQAAADQFAVIENPTEQIALEHRFRSLGSVDWNGRRIELEADEGGRCAGLRCARRSRDGTEELCEPPFAVETLSHLTRYGNAVYASTIDRHFGFALWRLEDSRNSEPTWTSVLDRGAQRFAHNGEILSALVHDDALFLVVGTPPGARAVESKYFSYRGFEVLRLDHNERLDLLVGELRFSAEGLLVPLSGLGPGLDVKREIEFASAISHQGLYVLAGIDEDGLVLWSSQDGEDWRRNQTLSLSHVVSVDDCELLCWGSKLVVLVRAADGDGGPQSQLFVADMPADGGDNPTQPAHEARGARSDPEDP